MDKGILKNLIEEYQSLEINQVVNHEKFNQYAITHHSTAIEGCTLSQIDTELLLDEGITPKGKPLADSLMVKDHYEALKFVLYEAEKKTRVTESFICEISSLVMKNTGAIYYGKGDEQRIDVSKGQYRKGNVSAGFHIFPRFEVVPQLMEQFVADLQNKMEEAQSLIDKVHLSFYAHIGMVSIHPFYDGNGRTSRLLMNFLQHSFELPLGLVYREDKALYIEAIKSTNSSNETAFIRFMETQYCKHLEIQIEECKKAKTQEYGKGKGLSYIF